MAKSPLLVELFEEDAEVIASLSQKAKTAQELKEYKSFISDYNAMIKSSVEKYWKYNEKVEYKTQSEVKKLKESKNNKYVILPYIKQADGNMDAGFKANSGVTIPALSYSKIESSDKKPDYKICVPSSEIRKDNKYLECDFKFALIGIQAHLKWMIQNNKTVQFNEYAEIVWKDNCSKLKNTKVQVEKSFLQQKAFLQKELTVADAKEAYGHDIEFVTAEELSSSYTSNKKGTAVLLIIPYGTM